MEVLQADGGDYAVCVNAATLALIDAGIPIRDVCCAVTCGLAIKDNTTYTLLDLGKFFGSKLKTWYHDFVCINSAYSEENGRMPTVVATGMPKTGELVFFEVESRLHLDYLDQITKDISEAVSHVYHQLNSIILQKREIR